MKTIRGTGYQLAVNSNQPGLRGLNDARLILQSIHHLLDCAEPDLCDLDRADCAAPFRRSGSPVRYARQQPAERRQRGSCRVGEKAAATRSRLMARSIGQTISLADATGQPLCKPAGMAGLERTWRSPIAFIGGQVGQQYPVEGSGRFRQRETVYVPAEPAACAAKTELVQDLLRFSFPQLPVAIVWAG